MITTAVLRLCVSLLIFLFAAAASACAIDAVAARAAVECSHSMNIRRLRRRSTSIHNPHLTLVRSTSTSTRRRPSFQHATRGLAPRGCRMSRRCGFHGQLAAGWEVMLHGNLFLQLLHEHAPEHRGATQAGSINWVMAMARRELGGARLGLRGMMSLEPWTISGCGYPNLLATASSAMATRFMTGNIPTTCSWSWLPNTIVHCSARFVGRRTADRWENRRSGLRHSPIASQRFPNPLSPIAHHWLDSTHISYGVLTAGVYGPRWKVEGSVFNGREPDERRYDFDFAALDSVAGRLWFLRFHWWLCRSRLGASTKRSRVMWEDPRWTSTASRRQPYHRPFGAVISGRRPAWGANRELGKTTMGSSRNPRSAFREGTHGSGALK